MGIFINILFACDLEENSELERNIMKSWEGYKEVLGADDLIKKVKKIWWLRSELKEIVFKKYAWEGNWEGEV